MKPGYKSTEFWFAAIAAALNIIAPYTNVNPQAAQIVAAISAVYACARTVAKTFGVNTGDSTTIDKALIQNAIDDKVKGNA